MMPKRLTRTLAAGGLGFSLILGMLAIPTVVLAATPNWVSGPTVNLPDIVKEGAAAGFATTITNNGPSNISQLSVTAFSDQPFEEQDEGTLVNPGDVDGSAVPVYAAVYRNGTELTGACPSPLATPLICTVAGGLASGGVATLVVAFPTSGTEDIGLHGFWQSNGTGSSFCVPGDNSQGDCLPFHSDATTVSDDGNRGGGFSIEDGGLAESDGISSSNATSTSLKAPAGVKNVILTVADDGAVTKLLTCSPECVDLPTSELHLGDGSPLAAGSFMKVVIQFHKTALKGINFGKLTVVHFDDEGNFLEEVPTRKSCDGSSLCAMFQNISGGHGQVTMYLNQNGFVKYH
jgi:hypothetical protein